MTYSRYQVAIAEVTLQAVALAEIGAYQAALSDGGYSAALIEVESPVYAPSLDFSDARNSMYL
jgi:hypothetical protein